MRPLHEETEQAHQRIADANRAFEPAPGEQAEAWARLQRAMQHGRGAERARFERRRARRARWRWLVGAGAVATAALALWLIVRPRPLAPLAYDVSPLAARAPAVAGRSARAVDVAPAPSIDPAPAPARARPPVALAPGRSWLAAGVRARLAPRGAAMVQSGSAPAFRVVSLLRGRLDLDIAAGATAAGVGSFGGGAGPAPALMDASASPSRVEVQVASYRLQADPGRFSVRARGETVEVVVHSGKLAVWSSRRLLATVVAGQRWTNLSSSGARAAPPRGDGVARDEATGVAAAAAPATSDAPVLEPPGENRPATGADDPDCARLTRDGDTDGALACFTHASERSGLVGELALMEVARIRRDVKGDLAGAERALAEHRRRFPRGALALEASGARVELLVRLSRPADALAESAHLVGGEAIFWRAVCLAKLGRTPEAARAFDEYLARPDGKRHAEATRMRRELAP